MIPESRGCQMTILPFRKFGRSPPTFLSPPEDVHSRSRLVNFSSMSKKHRKRSGLRFGTVAVPVLGVGPLPHDLGLT